MSPVSDDLQNNWAAADSSIPVARPSDCVTLDQNLKRLQDNIRELSIAPMEFSRPEMSHGAHAKRESMQLAGNADCLREDRKVDGLVDEQSSPEGTGSESRDTDSIDTAVLDSYLDDPPTPDSSMYYVRQICFDSLPLSPRQKFLSEVKCKVPQPRMTRHRSDSCKSRYKDAILDAWKAGHSGDICRSMPDVTIHSRPYRRATVTGDTDDSTKPWISSRKVSGESMPNPCDRKQHVASSSYRTEIRSMRLSGVWAGDAYTGNAGSTTQRRISSNDVSSSEVSASECVPSTCTEGKILETAGKLEAVQSITSLSVRDERVNDNMVGKVLDVDCYKLSLSKNGNSPKDVLTDNSQTTAAQMQDGDDFTGQETTTSTGKTVEETTSRVCQDALHENDGDRTKSDNEDSISNASVDMEEVLRAFETICGDDGSIRIGADDDIKPEVVCHSPEGAADAELQTALSKLRADKAVSGERQCDVPLYLIVESNILLSAHFCRYYPCQGLLFSRLLYSVRAFD